MSYSAPNVLLMPVRHSIDTQGDSGFPTSATFTGTGAWPSANLAIYAPVVIPSPVVVVSLWFASTTTATGNIDMALYTSAGTAVVSATAGAKTAAAVEQVFDVTNTLVGPGVYYVGLSSDSSTDTFLRYNPAAPACAAFGVLTEASAYPLPSTATFAIDHTLAFVPVMGVFLEPTTT